MKKRGIKPPSVDCPCISQTSEGGSGVATNLVNMFEATLLATVELRKLNRKVLCASCPLHILKHGNSSIVAYIDIMAVSI